jgi:hypothetical protein
VFDFLKNAAVRRIIGSLVRHGLNALGMWLVSQGLAEEADVLEVVALASPLIVSVLWSLYQKSRQGTREAVALDLPKGSEVDDLNRAMQARDRHGR